MERIEILTGEQRRRRYTPQEKAKQVLEDALCNWQKSPAHYLYFTG